MKNGCNQDFLYFVSTFPKSCLVKFQHPLTLLWTTSVPLKATKGPKWSIYMKNGCNQEFLYFVSTFSKSWLVKFYHPLTLLQSPFGPLKAYGVHLPPKMYFTINSDLNSGFALGYATVQLHIYFIINQFLIFGIANMIKNKNLSS